MIRDYLRMALQSLTHRKLRSWLTMLGIFIGITAVVAIISLGQGLQVAIDDSFSELGTDKIFISPGTGELTAGSTAANLTEHDRRIIERVPGVQDTLGFTYKNARLSYKDEESVVLITGISLTDSERLYRDMFGLYLEQGRLLTKSDGFKAVLGYDYTRPKKLFTKAMRLGDRFTINNNSFKIVGFNEKLGNSADDQSIYVTSNAYTQIFGERVEEDYKTIIARVSAGADASLVGERIKRDLRNDRDRDEGDEDFTVQTPEEILGSFNTILLIVNVVIIGIAAISLLIGGIGIMNTMYTAVLERRREIGIMKAIGARNSDIMLIFLIEAGLLGLVGGAVGVAGGLAISKLVELFGSIALGTPYLRAWWSWPLIFGALAFSFLIGALSGLTPAWQASKQQPVESLRYE